MTFEELPPPNFKLTKVSFKYHHCICLKIPEILRYHMIFTAGWPMTLQMQLQLHLHLIFSHHAIDLIACGSDCSSVTSLTFLLHKLPKSVDIIFQAAAAISLQVSGHIQAPSLNILDCEKELPRSSIHLWQYYPLNYGKIRFVRVRLQLPCRVQGESMQSLGLSILTKYLHTEKGSKGIIWIQHTNCNIILHWI